MGYFDLLWWYTMIGYRMLYIGNFDLWSIKIIKAMLIWYDRDQTSKPKSLRRCPLVQSATVGTVSTTWRRRRAAWSQPPQRGGEASHQIGGDSHWHLTDSPYHYLIIQSHHGDFTVKSCEIWFWYVLMWEISIQDLNFIACQFTASSLPNIGNELMNTGVNEVKRCRSRHTINKHQSTYNIKIH